MNTVLDIGTLTRTGKLRAVGELWEDLSRPKVSTRRHNGMAMSSGSAKEPSKRLLRERPK